MRLPPRFWRLWHSRRFRIAAVSSAFGLLIVVPAFYAGVNVWGRKVQREWLKGLPGRGFETRASVYFGEDLADADNALAGPLPLARFGEIFSITGPGSRRLLHAAMKRELGLSTSLTALVAPPLGSEEATADWILTANPELEAAWPETREALKRPNAAYRGRSGDDRIRIILEIREAGDFASVHALAEMAKGQREEALKDLEALVNLERHALQSRPTTVSVVMAWLQQRKVSNLVWEGLRRGVWDESSLQQLSEMLGTIHPSHDAIGALRGNIALHASFVAEDENFAARATPLSRFNWNSFAITDWSRLKPRLIALWFCTRPSGFALSRTAGGFEEIIESGIQDHGSPRERFTLADLILFQSRSKESPRGEVILDAGPSFNQLETCDAPWPILESLVRNAFRIQADLELTRTGIALERYRLKNGSYPERLEALVPAFLAEPPPDPYSGKTLRYRLQPDGSPLVWSIGQNLMDDGGLPKRESVSGDPVWLTRPIPGYTEKDYISN